jgi:hypothetical protein
MAEVDTPYIATRNDVRGGNDASSQELFKPLSIIFNDSLATSIIPEDWRSAEVTAILRRALEPTQVIIDQYH